MAKFLIMVKEGNALVPADPYSAELLDGYKNKHQLKVDIRSDRSRGKLNEYWAGLGLLVANFDDEDKERWTDSKKLHKTMMEALGYSERVYRLDGTYRMEVDSVALDNMDEETFLEVFERIRAAVVRRWGWDPWDEWKKLKEEEKIAKRRMANDWRRNWRPGDA